MPWPPILQLADDVRVVIVEETASEQQGDAPDEDIGRYLSRHGVRSEIRLVSGWSNVSAAILNEVTHAAADLVVLGAYGHSRLREWRSRPTATEEARSSR